MIGPWVKMRLERPVWQTAQMLLWPMPDLSCRGTSSLWHFVQGFFSSSRWNLYSGKSEVMSPPMRVSRKTTRDWLWFAPAAPCPLISIRFIASESGV